MSRECQYSVKGPIKCLQMKIFKTGGSHSKWPGGRFWLNWGQGRGGYSKVPPGHPQVRPWAAFVFLKTKQNWNLNHLCLEIKTDHNFSNMWKDKLLGSLPAWPGLRVSHSQEAPRSWCHKASRARIILLCSPGSGSGAEPPRLLALQHAQVLTDTFCSQSSPQPALQVKLNSPLNWILSQAQLRRGRGRGRKEKRQVREEVEGSSFWRLLWFLWQEINSVPWGLKITSTIGPPL